MARVPLPSARAWPAEMRAALVPLSAEAHGRPRLDLDNRPNGRDVLAAFANHPALAHAYNTFNGYVQYDSTLTSRQMEINVK